MWQSDFSQAFFSVFQSITEKEKFSEVRVTEVSLAAVCRELFTNRTRKSRKLFGKLVSMADGW